jgi:hypothetical protein
MLMGGGVESIIYSKVLIINHLRIGFAQTTIVCAGLFLFYLLTNA